MSITLHDRVAIVTGGSRGIGKRIAAVLGGRGARIAIAARDRADLAGARDQLAHVGVDTLAVPTDVADEAAVNALVETVLDRWGRLDVVVANAGGVDRRAFLTDMGLDDWNRALAVNTTGVFLLARACVPAMRERGFGRFITISSRAAVAGGVLQAGGCANVHYAAAKAGVIGFTKALAMELAGSGITANVVAPGPVATEFFLSRRSDDDRDELRARIPVGRIGDVDDVADAVAYLATDNGYVTGQVLHVNGGTWVG